VRISPPLVLEEPADADAAEPAAAEAADEGKTEE
jgi:large subunit ribosomal protein L25